MEFAIAAAILIVLILGILAYPWWHRRRGAAPSPLSGEQLAAELGDDVATGLLAAEDLRPAARDLETGSPAEATAAGPARQRWSWGVAGLLLVPIAAGVLYIHFGDWRAALLGEQAATVHQMRSSLARLRSHLQAHPDDTQGWIDLGEGNEALQDYPAAAQAYGRAVALESPPDPDILALWGEAQILANPHDVTDQERRIFSRVLELDPNNARGLWYGGLIALSSGDRAEARRDWSKLLAEPDVPPQVAGIVRSHMSMLGPAAASAASTAAAAAAPARYAVTVSLGPALATHFSPGETLFVFARDPHGGPPLAVRKLAVNRFPVTVVLDDDSAMVAGHDLSSASGPLEIVARLSRSGTAAPQAGDLEGTRRVSASSDARRLDIALDRVLGAGTGGAAAPGS